MDVYIPICNLLNAADGSTMIYDTLVYIPICNLLNMHEKITDIQNAIVYIPICNLLNEEITGDKIKEFLFTFQFVIY